MGHATTSDRLADAEREVETSRQRLRETREQVVRPLQDYAAENNFASLISESLTQGRRKGAGG